MTEEVKFIQSGDGPVTVMDARLVRAAPELLEVCEETLVKLEHLNECGVVQMPLAMERLRAVIAKARGEPRGDVER